MRVAALALVLLVTILFFEYATADKKHRNYEEPEGYELHHKKRGQAYEKYNKNTNKQAEAYHKKEMRRNRWDTDEDTSEEDVIKYRRKKVDNQKKKTLGDVFHEKKMKKQEKKERFKKNVLKHFESDDSDEVVSSEENIAPLRKFRLDIDCNSLEEECE